MGRPRTPLSHRIERNIEIITETGCWIWTASLDRQGYGRIPIYMNGKKHATPRLAHRVSYETYIGPIPEGLDLDHLCRVRACVNPKHLEPVTRKVNLQRGVGVGAVGRAIASEKQRAKTHCPHGHEWNEANTYLYQKGKIRFRTCRLCQKRKDHNRRHKTTLKPCAGSAPKNDP